MFEWNDSYSVGIPHLDAQHKQLFALIQELHSAMLKGQARAAIGGILDRLIDYTVKHFTAEEATMRNKNYAGLPQHKMIHDQFTSQVKKFQQDYKSGVLSVNMDVMNMLQHWLVDHIQGTDMKYASVF